MGSPAFTEALSAVLVMARVAQLTVTDAVELSEPALLVCTDAVFWTSPQSALEVPDWRWIGPTLRRPDI